MTSQRSDGLRASDRVALPPVFGFGVEVHREGTTCRVAVIGEMDLSNVGRVDVKLSELVDQRPQRLVLDLRQLTFMDSSGLRLILKWADRARLEGLNLVLLQGGPDVRRLFEITGTLDRLTFVAADTAETDGGRALSVPVIGTAPVGHST